MSLLFLVGCTKDQAQSGGLDPIVPGSLAVTVSGLPAGGSAGVTLQGPAGYSHPISGTETVLNLTPGSYTLTASAVTADGDVYSVAPETQPVTVRPGPGASAADVGYSIATGRLAVAINGIATGSADVSVSGPGGFSHHLTGSDSLKGLEPGNYTVKALAVEVDGDTYLAATDSVLVLVTPGTAPSPAAASYAQSTGRLDLALAGVPAGAAATVTIGGPGNFSKAVTESALLKGLAPGSYTIQAPALAFGGYSYQALVTSSPVAISAGQTPSASVTYAISTGALTVTLAGLPGSAPGHVTVTGPGGFNHIVVATETLTDLAPGSYTVAAANVTVSGSVYTGQPSVQTAAIVPGTTPVVKTVTYSIGTGGLLVTVGGLPNGVNAAVTVTGPGGFNRPVTATQTLTGLTPGSYTVQAAAVSSGGQTYTPSAASQSVSVAVGTTPTATVTYAGTLGGLTVTVSGLPGGASGAITVTGPAGYNHAVTSTQTLTGLAAGSYTVAAAAVSSGGQTYNPSPASQSRAVTAGATASALVTYAAAPQGNLTVTISGLPGGTNAAVTVTGPGGYNQALTATQTLSGLLVGTYSVGASIVSSGAQSYSPAPASQNVAVSSGATASATVTYSLVSGATLNLVIDGMYLTQAAQVYNGSTPLITGRDAYLRVFVKANQANTAQPAVRVRLYSGASLIQTSTITAPGASVPTTVDESLFTNSWNLLVPAVLVQPNLKILADVDPANGVPETNEADNTFPTSGTPFAEDVRTVPTWNARVVPVLQQANGLQANATAGNLSMFLDQPLKVLPVAAYNVDVRAVYTTTAPALQSNDGNGSWGTILNEMWALRSADASNRYYYGVVKTSYGSGVAGMGYIGGGVNVAIGWDNLPSGSGVMAHEVGHNMGKQHSPCGGAGNPDPSYPYAGGGIGIYGLDVATATVKIPTSYKDFMGYCNPNWVSDYTWSQIITYRQSNPNYAPPAPSAQVAGLLVWGRITPNGTVLEPAFRVAAPTSLPTGSGDYRVEGLALDGRVLFSYPVEPVHTMVQQPGARHEEHFAAVLPLDAGADRDLARLRFVGPGILVERVSAQAALPGNGRLFLQDPRAQVSKPNAALARLVWDGATYPVAMVRDPLTGQVLSFARGGTATIWTGKGTFDVVFSDGVRSVARTVR